jgi:hypothetical protein
MFMAKVANGIDRSNDDLVVSAARSRLRLKRPRSHSAAGRVYQRNRHDDAALPAQPLPPKRTAGQLFG